jgi:magnesium chelatase family protein
MFSTVTSYAPLGIEGEIVSVEVDLRTGIPGIDIVGLPDGAVREAKERVRVAIRNAGFTFPQKRILVNLAPAGLRKEGASYDLPIAVAILAASEQVPFRMSSKVMVLGELNLAGQVRPVKGILSAVGSGLAKNLETFLVPIENIREARALGNGRIIGLSSLGELPAVFGNVDREPRPGERHSGHDDPKPDYYSSDDYGDLSEIRGQWIIRRAIEVAAAGRHHMFLFGPPGCGKTA